MVKKSLTLIGLIALLLCFYVGTSSLKPTLALPSYPPATMAHYFYDFPDGNMYVYDMDNNFALVYSTTLPTQARILGVAVSAATKMLYLSYGGASGPGSNGGILKYDLVKNAVVWQQNYTFGADQLALTPDGKTIYLPDGEHSTDGTWNIINAADGSVIGSITAGIGPHDGLASLNGQHVYMGGLGYNYLEEASTSTNTIIQKMGPLLGGVRPFTVNGTETYAFITEQGFVGFQVANIATGAVLYTVTPPGFTGTYSHGISLSPDESQIYLMDHTNSMVHVFSLAGFPGAAPTDIKDIPVNTMSGNESPCSADCVRDGWLLHSSDGKYVFSGDSGDIINTATMTPLPRDTSSSTTIFSTLQNTRKFVEVDWSMQPGFTTTHFGLGYVTTPTPTVGSTPTPTPTPTSGITPTPTSGITPTPTPTPGTVLAQDTFMRPNQSLWGTASDGHIWGGDAGTNVAFSIANNTGLVTNAGASLSAPLGPIATNADVLFTGKMSAYNSTNLGSVLRWTNGNNWYKAYIDGGRLIIQKRVNGAIINLASVPFAASGNTLYSLRFEVIGTTLQARVWLASGSEPTTWMAKISDSTFASGQCGLRMFTQNGVTATYTSFVATAL
jgi:DNA-binding beta-propeller fold protein YncE